MYGDDDALFYALGGKKGQVEEAGGGSGGDSPGFKQGGWESEQCPPGYSKNAMGKCVKVTLTPQNKKTLLAEKETSEKKKAAQKAIDLGQEGVGAAEKIPDMYRDYVAKLALQQQSMPGEFERAGAQALAPVYGQFGMGGAAASPAAGLVGAQVSGDIQAKAAAALRQLDRDVLEGRISAEEAVVMAKDLGIQVQKMIMEKPSADDWNAEAEAALEAEWGRLLELHKKWHGGYDKQAIYHSMKAMIEGVADDALRQKWMKRIASDLTGM